MNDREMQIIKLMMRQNYYEYVISTFDGRLTSEGTIAVEVSEESRFLSRQYN